MVYNYKRKSGRGKWSEEAMRKAIEVVLKGEMGYTLAAKSFSVPQTTLERKVKKARANDNKIENVKVPLGPILPVFSQKEEDELVDYLLDMESRFFGLTTKDLKQLVYQLSVRNNKISPFNSEKAEAGKDWVKNFLKRHPELSIRKPENTSAARAAGFNRVVVTNFFNFLANVYDEHSLTPDRIYNCDETGVSVVPKTRSKILARKGRKQVGSIVSAERGTTITVEICFSATGHYMPPMMVFPRKRMNPELMLNAAPGAWGVCTDSGWMTAERFLEWFKQFVVFSGASIDRPVLLLLDGHSTHTQNIDLINEARANGVIILCFPPHTTHRLQPADVVFMRPLSIFYDQAVSTWLRTNPGMVVTVRQVAELFGKAFVQTATMSTAINGFKTTGIWPHDPSVFSDSDFEASLTTEIPFIRDLSSPINQEDVEIRGQTNAVTVTALSSPTSTTVNTVATPTITTTSTAAVITPEVTSLSPSPGCSYWPNPEQNQSNFTLVSPKQLMPLPVTKKTLRVTKRRGKTAVITSSPYKQELEELVNKKCDAEKLKKKTKEIRQTKKEKKQKKEDKQKLVKTKATKYNPKKRNSQSSSVTSDLETENTPCLYCTELYFDSKEGWIACSSCGKWSHCGCAGVDDDDAEIIFICELCTP